jgi:hypothetical protein
VSYSLLRAPIGMCPVRGILLVFCIGLPGCGALATDTLLERARAGADCGSLKRSVDAGMCRAGQRGKTTRGARLHAGDRRG